MHGSVFAAEWRSDDHVLAIGGSDYSVSAWDVQHELCVAHYDAHNGSARALAWDPDDRRLLASGARDGAIYLWDLRQSAAAVHIHKAHGMPRTRRGARVAGVTSLAYVNGQLASSCSENGVVKMWDLRAAQAPRATSTDLSVGRAGNTRPHGVSSLVYAQTRRRLYAACTDGWYVSLSDAVCTSSTRVSRRMRFRRTSRGRCTMPCSAATRCTRALRCTTSATLRSAATRATLSSGTRTRRTPPCSPVRTKKSTSSD